MSTPVSGQDLNWLIRDPLRWARFQSTGRLPATRRPGGTASPLGTLLSRLYPRERLAIKALRVGPELGFTGCRTFMSAEQAFRWIDPLHGADSPPSRSWRDMRFAEALSPMDLAPFCSAPPGLLAQAAARLGVSARPG